MTDLDLIGREVRCCSTEMLQEFLVFYKAGFSWDLTMCIFFCFIPCGFCYSLITSTSGSFLLRFFLIHLNDIEREAKKEWKTEKKGLVKNTFPCRVFLFSTEDLRGQEATFFSPLNHGLIILFLFQPPSSILAQVQLLNPVPVHAISFNCADTEANQFLCQLAAETGGR